MPTLETYNGYLLWHYIPNRPAAVIFTILFVITTAYHAFLMFRHRLWFCIPFVIGGIFEFIGYVGRIMAYDETGELSPYILQSIFLLLAPILFAASLYMTLGRVVVAISGAQYSLISPRWLIRIFVTADILSFMIQGGGAGILVQGGSASKAQTGQRIIVGGLVFQLVAFAVFCLNTLLFHLRYRKHGRTDSVRHIPWQGILVMLYLTSGFIMIRNIFRAIQYAMDQDGYLLTHEWTVYVMDGMLMFLTMLDFAWKYPSQLLKPKTADLNLEMAPGQEERGHK
ncbi:RTA1 like domain-containing protein [Trichoderma ceciliae]